tara:strand:- start:1479 stop:1787 length:309 start_codon:yes stop_codon:yes gene_type:complete
MNPHKTLIPSTSISPGQKPSPSELEQLKDISKNIAEELSDFSACFNPSFVDELKHCFDNINPEDEITKAIKLLEDSGYIFAAKKLSDAHYDGKYYHNGTRVQ